MEYLGRVKRVKKPRFWNISGCLFLKCFQRQIWVKKVRALKIQNWTILIISFTIFFTDLSYLYSFIGLWELRFMSDTFDRTVIWTKTFEEILEWTDLDTFCTQNKKNIGWIIRYDPLILKIYDRNLRNLECFQIWGR